MGAITGKHLEAVRARMAMVDAMPPELRALVHEHGLTIIKAFLDAGVTKPRQIRHIIATVREGSREIGNRDMTEAQRREAEFYLFCRLTKAGYTILPREPSPGMVAASINALDDVGAGRVSKATKHHIRLAQAMRRGHAEVQALLSGEGEDA